MTRIYLTTTIPYVNAAPHLGHALEAVQADVLARYHRGRGDEVRLATGTDDNSLKNVLAAQSAGLDVQEFVDRNAAAFAGLREPLAFSYDDFIRTSRDPRHRAGVARIWRACAAAGDLYRGRYEGPYCVGCEHYLTADELAVDGTCPEHGTAPYRLAEENWFFRLSRYADRIADAIGSGRLRVEPAVRRHEVLGFLAGGLRDLAVSRSRQRARGWGIPVPEDPGQVVYVWWDALGNYITGLDYGTGGDAYRYWWLGSDRRIHLVGKGVLRFHAVYWPAMLLSAGVPLPTDILVHDYLTVNGRKISKSTGTGVDPVELARRYGTDAVRWWLLRDVPRVGEADFNDARLVDRANGDLAGGAGNLVHRVVTMVHRYRDGRVPPGAAVTAVTADAAAAVTGVTPDDPAGVAAACERAAEAVDAALAGFDLRRATGALHGVVEQANRYLEQARPWELAGADAAGDAAAGSRLDGVLAVLIRTCRVLADQLAPFLPGTAARIAAACTPVAGWLPAPRPVFARLEPGPVAGVDAGPPAKPDPRRAATRMAGAGRAARSGAGR